MWLLALLLTLRDSRINIRPSFTPAPNSHVAAKPIVQPVKQNVYSIPNVPVHNQHRFPSGGPQY